MLIDSNILDKLTEWAKQSPRLRMNYDLRNSDQDQSQRMLNALKPETILPIHRHCDTSETVAIIRGAVRQNFYDDNGNVIETLEVHAGDACPFFVVPKGAWHNSESLQSGTIIFEAKDGSYKPLISDDMLKSDIFNE